MWKRWLGGLLLAGTLVTADAAPAKNVGELQRQLQTVLAGSGSPGALWGIQVNSQRTRNTWFATNAAQRFVPASNTKLFTAALALDRLGADYRWITSLRTSGKPDAAGTLGGDLLVVGSGDPTRCGRLYAGKWEVAFAPLVQAVRTAGIRRISGNLVCDESRFRGLPYGSGWNWDDLSQDYGAAVSALTAEENTVQIVATPADRIGDPATVRLEPLSAGLSLRNRLTTGPENSAISLEFSRLPGDVTLDVTGTVPRGGGPVVGKASVPVPARWFGELFREALRRSGIEIAGRVVVVTATEREREPLDDSVWREVAGVPSPRLGEVLREMMKSSQNLFAQLLLLTVGSETERYPRDDEPAPDRKATTETLGIRALDRFLKQAGFPGGDVVLEEGSGLSRKNLLTPRSVVRLLEQMPAHRWATVWQTSLPVGGVDGTLRNRFTQLPARGNVQAKTGSLSQISALSGYLTNTVGEPVVFSILVNHYLPLRPSASARAEVDQLVELLVQSAVKEP